ncbi:MAG: sigma-54-dependent Fis family transcriptional regulator [Nitrosomonadales bacterium]|nr:sigma-54-dependent Fis family transcriptional regulator [Nitrosomonadales bacterium]
MRRHIQISAAAPFPVLIEGESGTGKELVATALHRSSGNPGPLLPINCAAIPINLLESTLFGHTKGAYTGADRAQSGLFESAGLGTLFLDEVGELPMELQAKLLRVLENGEFRRIGETSTRLSRARIIAASNRDLRRDIQTGRFRADLFHRLDILTVRTPPLREMGSDKLLLLDHFRTNYSAQMGRPPFLLDAQARRCWESHSFPGNTRELRNLVIRLLAQHSGKRISAKQLEAELAQTPGLPSADGCSIEHTARHYLQRQADFNLPSQLKSQERLFIEAALNLSFGNISAAAKRLGLPRTTLCSRIAALKILPSP